VGVGNGKGPARGKGRRRTEHRTDPKKKTSKRMLNLEKGSRAHDEPSQRPKVEKKALPFPPPQELILLPRKRDTQKNFSFVLPVGNPYTKYTPKLSSKGGMSLSGGNTKECK